ncbi:Arm DNA-binding domain-containing protein, partial [Campylobacter ureolyticus]
MATLTFTQIKKLKYPDDKKMKAYSINSNCSLYLVCFNTGTKLYKKRIKTGYVTLGNFNEISLAEARELATNYEKQSSLSRQMKINDLFNELLDLRYPNTKENQNKRRKYKNRVSKWILDKIGNKLISEVNKDELLNALNGANLEVSQRALAIYRDMLKIDKEINKEKILLRKEEARLKYEKDIADLELFLSKEDSFNKILKELKEISKNSYNMQEALNKAKESSKIEVLNSY